MLPRKDGQTPQAESPGAHRRKHSSARHQGKEAVNLRTRQSCFQPPFTMCSLGVALGNVLKSSEPQFFHLMRKSRNAHGAT